jgi:phosphatidylinositol 4-kinase
METITDALSVHSIKKQAYSRMTAVNGVLPAYTLYDHFRETFTGPAFRKAQDAFMKSLASYSVICYILQIKDRHNGNILIDKAGHIIHIDFGFMLGESPGSLGFEVAPFKLTQDYIDILGDRYDEWKALFGRLLRAVDADRIKALAPATGFDADPDRLIAASSSSSFTALYDKFQQISQQVL